MSDLLSSSTPPLGHPTVRSLIHEINNANNLGLLNASLLLKVWEDLSPLLAAQSPCEPQTLPGGMPLSLLLEEIPAMLKAQEEAAERIRVAMRSLRDLDLVPRADT